MEQPPFAPCAGEATSLSDILGAATDEQAKQIFNVTIQSVGNLTIANASDVENSSSISVNDSELLNTFKEIMCHQNVNADAKRFLIELRDDMVQLERSQKDDVKSKSILEKISDKFHKIEQLGTNVAGAWPYIKNVYKVLQPFAKSKGIDLPELPPNI